MLGLVTSERAGVPETPSAGVIIACAEADESTERRRRAAERGLENIFLVLKLIDLCFLCIKRSAKEGPASERKDGQE